jgi:hypothetical protein
MKLISTIAIATALLSTTVSAKEGDWYGGVQLSGLSAKYDISNDSTVQGIVNFWGYGYDIDVFSFTGRYIRKVKQEKNYNLYWVAGAGVTTVSASNSTLGTAFHGEAGVGAEYDIRGLDRDFIPLFISAEIDAGFVSVSGYGGAGVGIDIGLHYKF